METASVVDEIAERDKESRQLADIESCLNAIERLQAAFLTQFSASDLEKTSGRRCVLGVSGLKYHTYEKFFEVSPVGVRIVQPYEEFNTYIQAPLDSVLRVLKGVLAGDTSAFSSEWARGQAHIIGEKHVHDGYVFSQIFSKLAEMIKRYREMR